MEPVNINGASQLPHINWTPGIGDPTFVGWMTVVAYFMVSALCVACAMRIVRNQAEPADVQRKVWWVIAVALALLGVNKQLDFQTLLTEAGKMIAKRQGWYEQRKWIQALFISGILISGLCAGSLACHFFQNALKENRLAFAGIVFLCVFVVIRAASFHHMDLILGWHLGNFKLNWILELGGILCIMISAIICLRHRPKNVNIRWI